MKIMQNIKQYIAIIIKLKLVQVIISNSEDKDLQHRLRTLCNEFKDVFSNELPAAPAKIPEFHLTVKDNEWRVARNRAPPRAQKASGTFRYDRNLATTRDHQKVHFSTLQPSITRS